MSTRPPRSGGKQSWPLLLFLQWISIVPAAWGFAYCLWQVVGGVTIRRRLARDGLSLPEDDDVNSRLDYLVACMWSAASGYWCLSLSSGLLRRWLVYYDTGPAVLRLVSLHGIVFTSTHLTVVQIVGPREPVFAWGLCAFGAAITNTVQLWVTSNVRVKNKDQLASWVSTVPTLRANVIKRSTVMKPEKRRLSWDKVVRRTIIPLSTMSFVTMLVVMWELSMARRSISPLQLPAPVTAAALAFPTRTAYTGIPGSSADPWIIPGVLSTQSSTLSDSPQWSNTYAATFFSPPSLFSSRQYAAVESIFAHDPFAAIFVLSASLPIAFFEAYRARGYRIWVVETTPENLRQWRWTVGPYTEGWLASWEEWYDRANFAVHADAYLRWIWMHNVGGTWVDLDSIVLQRPADSTLEFVSSASYLRLRRGWSSVVEVAEVTFRPPFNTSCIECASPVALLKHLDEIPAHASLTAITNLPSYLTDPLSVHLRNSSITSSRSWTTSSMNSSSPEASSLLTSAEFAFSLHISGPSTHPLELVHPPTYTFLPRLSAGSASLGSPGSVDGAFDGSDIIFLRGGSEGAGAASISVSAQLGRVDFGLDQRGLVDSNERRSPTPTPTPTPTPPTQSWSSSYASLADVNRVLSTIRYSTSGAGEGKEDKISITVRTGERELSGTIVVVVPRR